MLGLGKSKKAGNCGYRVLGWRAGWAVTRGGNIFKDRELCGLGGILAESAGCFSGTAR